MARNVQIQLLEPQVGYLDIKEGGSIPLTFGVADIRDVSKKAGTTSKSVKISGSKNANKIFSQLFDANVSDGTFDINKLQKCRIIENGLTILDNAYLQLVSIDKIQSIHNTEQGYEYTVLIKDSVANFFTAIDKKELTDIGYGDLNHELTGSNIIGSFNNTWEDGYTYFFQHQSNDVSYGLNQFKAAVFGMQYFDRIFKSNGFEYEWNAFSADTVQFDKTIIPFNGEEIKFDQNYANNYYVEAENTGTTTNYLNLTAGQQTGNSVSGQTFPIEIIDNNGDYNPTLSKYITTFAIPAPNAINFTFEVDWEIKINNTSGNIAELVNTATGTFINNNQNGFKIEAYIDVIKNGQVGLPITSLIATKTINNAYSAATGTTTILTGTSVINLAYPSTIPNDEFTFRTRLYQKLKTPNTSSANPKWKNTSVLGDPLADVDVRFDITNAKLKIQPNLLGTYYNAMIDMNSLVPKKVTQSSFIASVLTLYNIFVQTDPTNINKLILQGRDEFYDSGSTLRWTTKLVKDKEQTLTLLPDLTNKKKVLTYKQDENDLTLKGYKDNINEVYGQVEFTFDSEYLRDSETKELIFSPMTMSNKDTNGIVLPHYNGVNPKTNIKLALKGENQTSANQYTIENYTNNFSTTTTIPLVGHFNKSYNPTFDLMFALNDYYFYDIGAKTNNTIFNMHWRRTMYQLNKGRMLTAYFNLTPKDISELKLNSKIEINNTLWVINKVIDYKAGLNEPTKVELISFEDELKLSKFKVRRPGKPYEPLIPNNPVKPVIGLPIVNPIRDLDLRNTTASNLFMSTKYTPVFGKNNIIGNDINNSLILGDNNQAYNKGMIIGDDNYQYGDSIIFGSNNFVSPEASGSMVVGNGITADTTGTLYADNIVISSGGTLNGISISSITGSSQNDYTTGATLVGAVAYFDRTDALSAYTLDLSSLTGASNTYVTGGTYNAGTLTLTRNDAVDVTITGFTTGGTGAYLPLSGGTLTGPLVLNNTTKIKDNRGYNPSYISFNAAFYTANRTGIQLSTDNGTFSGTSMIMEPVTAQIGAYDTNGFIGLYTNNSTFEMYNLGQTVLSSGNDLLLAANTRIEIQSPFTGGTPVASLMLDSSGILVTGTTSGGITTLNGLTNATQSFATSTTGTDFTISSAGSTHTFNLPTASAVNTGKLSSTDWSTFNSKQAGDPTLTALAAFNSNGIMVQTAADTFTARQLTPPAAGFTISNSNGVAGNPTFALTNDLAALEGLSSTGFAVRGATDIWVQRNIAGGSCISVTNGDGIAGNPTIALTGGTMSGSLTVTGNLTTQGNLLVDDFEQTSHATVQTTGGGTTTINTIPISSEYVYQIEANVCAGRNDTNSGLTSKILGSFKNNGGTVTQIGSQNIIMNTDFTGTANVTMSISGTNVIVQVTGQALTTIDWGCSIIIHRMGMGVI